MSNNIRDDLAAYILDVDRGSELSGAQVLRVGDGGDQ